MPLNRLVLLAMCAAAVACGSSDPAAGPDDETPNPNGPDDGPKLAGCPVLPGNHVFNSRIDGLRVHPRSDAFIATIGDRRVHLDLGTQMDQTADDFYGIPYNIVNGNA
ncbi:MAG TPA: hypothetical protein VLC93_16245, partial [Myxococcota bacterium]|nr:hypothetical protein [Myxococcota bacterium]